MSSPCGKKSQLLHMEMKILEGTRNGLVVPTSLKRIPSPTPRVGKPTSTPAPIPPPAFELEGAVSPGELVLVLRRGLSLPLGFAPVGTENSKMLPIVDVYRAVARPIGNMLDLTALQLLRMTALYMLATGEVHYYLHIQSITRMFLPSASSQKQ